MNVEEDGDNVNGVSLRCLNLYGRDRGCKVGADTGYEFSDSNSRRVLKKLLRIAFHMG